MAADTNTAPIRTAPIQTAPIQYVIVGGGLAAARAVEGLREHDPDGPVTVLTVEDELPYERPPLSKGYLLGDDPRDGAILHDEAWYAERGVEVRRGVMVTGLDAAAREVVAEDGERIGYDRLLLATGSWPRRLDVPGADLAGVLHLRDLWEADALKEVLDGDGPLVVIGAGWIGLEAASAARRHDVPVTVIDTADQPLQHVVGTQVGEVFAALHREHGVELLTGTGVREVVGDGAVEAVVDSHGTRHPAAAVLVAIGAQPQVDWPVEAGLAGSVAEGLHVDASMRTSDPHVWAAGDVAAVEHPVLGRRVRVEHWAWANDGGEAAGASMGGAPVTFDALPFFWSDQYDLGLEMAGAAEPDTDQLVVRGHLASRQFHALWLDAGVVRAGMHADQWDDGLDPVQELIRSGRVVDPARLADPDVPWDEL